MKDRFGLTLLLDADGRARIRGSAWHCSPENKKLLCYYAASQRFEHFYGISESRFSEIFFLAHHNDENIMKDILAGIVFLILGGEEVIGTETIKENEICRFFVLPKYQHKGFGRQLMDFAEKMITEEYSEIYLDSSFLHE